MIEPDRRFDNQLIKPVQEKALAKQAKIQERDAKKQAKIQERDAKKQAKIQERDAKKQAKIQEQELAKQAKIQEREEKKELLIKRKQRVKEIKRNYREQNRQTEYHFARLQLAQWRAEAQRRREQEAQRRREQQERQRQLDRDRQNQIADGIRVARTIIGRGLPDPNNDEYQLRFLERAAAGIVLDTAPGMQHGAHTHRAAPQPARLCNDRYRQLVKRDKLNAEKKQEQLICVDTAYEQEECPICLDPMGKTNNMILRCGHQACGDCIFHHFQTIGGTKCPVCREQITVRIKGWNPPIQ